MNIEQIKSELGVSTLQFHLLGEWLTEWITDDVCVTSNQDLMEVLPVADDLFINELAKTDKNGNDYTVKVICQGKERVIVLKL